MTKVIDTVRINYPAQNEVTGVVTIKVLLCEKEGEKFGCLGVGENEWILKNGRMLTFEDIAPYFMKPEETA